MSEKLKLTLFVVNPARHESLLSEFQQTLDEHFPEQYVLEVIDVLSMPEKAMENQVFATPMLMRHYPEPVLKMLLNISNLKDVLLNIQDPDNHQMLI